MTTSYLRISASGDDGYFRPQGSGYNRYSAIVPLNSGGSWWRFQNCPVTANSTVSGAFLIFQSVTGFHDVASGDFAWIYGDIPPNRIAPSSCDKAVNGRAFTDPIRWDFYEDWTSDDYSYVQSGTQGYYSSPNLEPILNTVISDPSYASGQSIMFFIESGNFRPDSSGLPQGLLWASGWPQVSGKAAAALLVDWFPSAVNSHSWGFVPPSSCEEYHDLVAGGSAGGYDLENWGHNGSLSVCTYPVTQNDGVVAFAPRTDVYQSTQFVTSKLLASRFNINIPTTSVVNGIEVKICKAAGPVVNQGDFVFTPSIKDYEVKLYHPSSGFIGVNKANTELEWSRRFPSNSPLNYIPTYYGGPWDTWGTVLGAGDVRASGFGVGFACFGVGTAEVDQIEMKVWYSPLYSAATGLPLYIQGIYPSSSGLNLAISGIHGMSSGLNLFLQCLISSGNVPLYMHGLTDATGNVNLYVAAPTPTSSSVSLYTAGYGIGVTGLNMFVKSNDVVPDSGDIFLSIVGNTAGVSGVYNKTSMFVAAANFPGSMNLFMLGDPTITKTTPMNMFTQGNYSQANNSTPFYLANSGTTSSVPMFVQGLSANDINDPLFPHAGVPASGEFNMFIKRPETAYANFFVMNASANDNVPLIVAGANLENSGVNLSCAGGVVTTNSSSKLYTHGF